MIKKKLEYNKYNELKNKYEKKVNILATIRLIIFIISLISFILKYYYYKILFNIIFILSLISFIILIMVHDKYYKIYNYYNIYVEIIQEYIKRTNGEWKNFKETGEEYLNNTNTYLQDLDILGKNSLYQLLNTASTIGGKRKLVNKLSNKNQTNLEEEQLAIKELTNNIKFCIDYQVSIFKYRESNTDLSTNLKELSTNIKPSKKSLILGITLTLITIFSFLLSISKIINMNYFYIIFIINFSINYLYSYIFTKQFIKLNKIITTYGNLNNIFEIIQDNKFTSKKLKNIQQNVNINLNIITKLKKIDNLNNLRNNLISNLILNGFTNLNIFILYYFSTHINNNLINLEQNINDIEELEANISVAVIGIIKENTAIPTLSNKVELSFTNIHHPLLDEKRCITNDFKTQNGVNIITGSNMGGKTSFLRTIGINIILMNSGGYVCASSFTSTYFKIFTSMRVNDDIEKGISTFYGELLRIKEMIEYLDKGNMLVLIDEIFKGTNYKDRIYGALEIIKKLNNKQTITLLTTHDFELCDAKNIKNYHVKEYYESEKINFDYKIREGKCNSTNARYLMKKLNIID